MSKLRLIDPSVTDSFEADTRALKMRVHRSAESKKITVQ